MIEGIEGFNKFDVNAMVRMLNNDDIKNIDKVIISIYIYTGMNELELSKLTGDAIGENTVKTAQCIYDFTPPKLIKELIDKHLKALQFKRMPMFDGIDIKQVIQDVLKM